MQYFGLSLSNNFLICLLFGFLFFFSLSLFDIVLSNLWFWIFSFKVSSIAILVKVPTFPENNSGDTILSLLFLKIKYKKENKIQTEHFCSLEHAMKI